MPPSAASAIFGSMGIAPRKGTFMSSAILFPPPERRIGVTVPQLGQANPLMFSTTPSTGSWMRRQKEMDFRTSTAATFCGVVTITAPSRWAAPKIWTTDSGSSPVPGGESMTR